MELWYPLAVRKPLGPQTQHSITPRIFVVHTMVGSLAGTHAMFLRDGYTGLESTFGLGGPYDSDGVVYQWQRLDYSADAQAAGNAYATSVETADGGHPERPWSDAQLDSLADLGYWWAKETGSPAEIVNSTTDKGFGYHRQFKAWNPHNHACPGDVRLRQYRTEVVPAIGKRLDARAKRIAAAKAAAAEEAAIRDADRPTLSRLLREGDHGRDVRVMQHLVLVGLDGDFGPRTRSALVAWQRKHHLTPDGVFGPASCRAAGWIWKG